MNNKCCECYNFKTKIITNQNIDNIENIKFADCIALKDHLKEDTYCRIWFCSKNILSYIYTIKHIAYNTINPNCPGYEGD